MIFDTDNESVGNILGWTKSEVYIFTVCIPQCNLPDFPITTMNEHVQYTVVTL